MKLVVFFNRAIYICIIIAFVLFVALKLFNSYEEKFIDRELVVLSQEINKKIPVEFFGNAILETTTTKAKTIVYKIRLVGLEPTKVTKDSMVNLQNQIFSHTANKMCFNEDVMKYMMSGAIFEYEYSGNNNIPQFTIKLDKHICLKMTEKTDYIPE